MSLRSKAKAAKKREALKQAREVEEMKIETNAVRLRSMTTGFARTERGAQQVQMFKQSKMPSYVFDRRTSVTHAEESQRFVRRADKQKQTLTPEMEAREKAAQERYSEMKSRVGPAYNKGPTQYLSVGELEAERRGELRRRS